MTRRGSHSTLAGWEPRTCHICHTKIVVSGDRALWFHYDHARKQGVSLHMDCWRNLNPTQLEGATP